MSLLSGILDKILNHPLPPASAQPADPSAPSPPTPTLGSVAQGVGQAAAGSAAVDVEKVFEDLASKSEEPLEWKNSIVDLLKLIGHDSSLAARQKLAEELHYPGDMSDSAAMNEWLHGEVMKQIAAAGGKLPAGL